MKKCSKCKIEKSEENFSTNGKTILADGSVVVYLKSHCKQCKSDENRIDRITNKERYLRNQWSKIKSRCTDANGNGCHYGMEYPDINDYLAWAVERSDFNNLFDRWVSSGCDGSLTPSIDRIDNNVGYVFSNMHFIPMAENRVKDRYKKTIMIFDGKEFKFDSRSAASKATGICLPDISSMASGKKKSVRGWSVK